MNQETRREVIEQIQDALSVNIDNQFNDSIHGKRSPYFDPQQQNQNRRNPH